MAYLNQELSSSPVGLVAELGLCVYARSCFQHPWGTEGTLLRLDTPHLWVKCPSTNTSNNPGPSGPSRMLIMDRTLQMCPNERGQMGSQPIFVQCSVDCV